MADKYITEVGKHFGYPDCCIESFEKTHGAVNNALGAKAGNSSGFIPCPSCAQKILDGKIELKDLITNRKHKHPFPKDNVMDALTELGYI